MTSQSRKAELLYGDSENNSNLYYASQFLVPDPVYFIQISGRSYLFLNDLEVDRGKREAKVDEVLSISELEKNYKKKFPKKVFKQIDLISEFLKSKKVSRLTLPYDFPSYAAFYFKKYFQIEHKSEPFWDTRLLKTSDEKKAITTALKHTASSIKQAYQILRESSIKGKTLYWKNKKLSSEILRQEIDLYLLKNNCLAQHTIVACGAQAVDPHERGSGPLSPNQSIVMDVFPRHLSSRYFADMTRSTVKGKASAELKKMWNTVKEAQEEAIKKIKPGVNAKSIHEGILNYFEQKGFYTGHINGRMQGFFHGTGHGLGLDIHEAPRVSKLDMIFKEGMVVTVEPGLYYEKIGGVRIEDVVYVSSKGVEVLSSCPKILEIE